MDVLSETVRSAPDRDGDLEFAVRRSRRARRARVTVHDHGDVVVTLPARAPLSLAADLVARHRGWLERQRAAARAAAGRRMARPALGEGRAILFHGILHGVVRVASPARRGRVEHVDLPSPELRVTASDVAAAAEPWLRRAARQALERTVRERAAELGVAVRRIGVRDQRTRWGSASGSGSLSFSWRLVMAPTWVLDYVVVHELAHLRHAGHGPRFWAVVRRIAPRTDEARRWLRAHEDELRHALD